MTRNPKVQNRFAEVSVPFRGLGSEKLVCRRVHPQKGTDRVSVPFRGLGSEKLRPLNYLG